MATLAKMVTKTLDIGVKDTKIDLSATIKSYDLTDTKFIFNIISNQGLNIDLTGSTAMYIVEYVHNSQNYAIQGEVDIIDSTTIAFSLPEDLKGYKGTVLIGLYVQMTDGTKIDIKDIVVRIEPSIMDKGIDFSARTYFEDFETVKAEVILEGEKAKTAINAVVSDVNGYADSQKQIIHNAVIDVQSTGNKAKADINAVLPTVQTQVSDLKTEIENLPDIPEVYTDLAEIKSYIGYTDTDIYGVEIDMTNRRFTRLAGAIGKNGGADFDNINAYKRRRCSVTNDGVVLAYCGDENFTESGVTYAEIVKNGVTYPVGTPVQVMVEQPKFYYKVVPLVVEPIANGKGYHMRKGRYYISDYPKSGFKVHPAFVRNGVERDKIYLSAYEGSIYDKSANAYLLDDEQVADFSADMLSSVTNAKPCSGFTHQLTRSNARLLAHNRGNGWEQQTIQTVSLTQLLFLIEYAKFNMQDVLGMGVTQKTDDGSTNMAEKTGSTTGLGNASGAVTNSNSIQIVSYRGEENPYGNIWKFVDGINVMANGIHAVYVADHDFNDKQSTGSYTDIGFTLAKTSGYVSAFGYSQDFDWLFLTSETSGNSSVPVGDYFWQNYTAIDDGGWRSVLLGATWDAGSSAGGFNWHAFYPSVNWGRPLSGRLVYLGG